MNIILYGLLIVIVFLFIRMKIMSAGINNVDAAEFKSLMKGKSTHILDVRTPMEVRQGKIKKAKNIDYKSSAFISQIGQLKREDTYLLYCRSGMRSMGAATKMKRLGFENVYNLKGGYMAWNRAKK